MSPGQAVGGSASPDETLKEPLNSSLPGMTTARARAPCPEPKTLEFEDLGGAKHPEPLSSTGKDRGRAKKPCRRTHDLDDDASASIDVLTSPRKKSGLPRNRKF